jgi:iron-sulfur cluster repair protein YtfE (RIC family)
MATRRNDESQDAVEMLKADHKKVRNLFQQYQDAPGAQKRPIAEQVFVELQNHAQLEEMIFYPAVDEDTDEEGQKLVEEARQEHQMVKDLIAELRTLTDEAEFDAKFQELQQNVEHHVEEEESEMFPLAEVELDDELEDLAEQMQEVKQQLAS